MLEEHVKVTQEVSDFETLADKSVDLSQHRTHNGIWAFKLSGIKLS